MIKNVNAYYRSTHLAEGKSPPQKNYRLSGNKQEFKVTGISFPFDLFQCLSLVGKLVDSFLQKEESMLFHSMLMASNS